MEGPKLFFNISIAKQILVIALLLCFVFCVEQKLRLFFIHHCFEGTLLSLSITKYYANFERQSVQLVSVYDS